MPEDNDDFVRANRLITMKSSNWRFVTWFSLSVKPHTMFLVNEGSAIRKYLGRSSRVCAIIWYMAILMSI